MFYVLLYVTYVHSSIAIILMGKRELIALLNLSSWCRMMVERLFLAVPRGCLQFVIVVFPDHTHLLFLTVVHSPSLEGLAFLIRSLRCWTKSKKKSPSGTDITETFVCLFDLILYVPSTIFQLYRDGSSWIEPVLR